MPCKLLIATVILCLYVGEWYPFSTFPMYSRLHGSTWFVTVTDGEDEPVGTTAQFGITLLPLKRIYAARFGALQSRLGATTPTEVLVTRAGEEALRHLLRESKPAPDAPELPERLRLWRTDVFVRDGEVARQTALLAEVAVP